MDQGEVSDVDDCIAGLRGTRRSVSFDYHLDSVRDDSGAKFSDRPSRRRFVVTGLAGLEKATRQ